MENSFGCEFFVNLGAAEHKKKFLLIFRRCGVLNFLRGRQGQIIRNFGLCLKFHLIKKAKQEKESTKGLLANN